METSEKYFVAISLHEPLSALVYLLIEGKKPNWRYMREHTIKISYAYYLIRVIFKIVPNWLQLADHPS